MDTPAIRLLQATNPKHRPLSTLRLYERFCAEVTTELGRDVLASIVATVARSSALTRGGAA